MAIKIRDSIPSKTNVFEAPDRMRAAVISGVECHYAVKGNLNESHPEQQDRASVFAAPGTPPKAFEKIISGVFAKMKQKSAALKVANPDFKGDCCTSVALVDPISGMMALGQKGDGRTYLVLKNKTNPDDVIIKRISTRHENVGNVNPRGQVTTGPNSVSNDCPVMWAAPDSWKEDTQLFVNAPEFGTKLERFTLIDIKKLAAEVLEKSTAAPAGPAPAGDGAAIPGLTIPEEPLAPRKPTLAERFGKKAPPAAATKAEAVKPKDPLDDYTLSLVMSSDGIMGGKGDPLSKVRDFLKTTARVNLSQGMLDSVSGPGAGAEMSHDNLSAVTLHNLTFGRGSTIGVCLSDGNHQGDLSHVRDGSIAAQASIDIFEEEMRALRTRGEHPAIIHRGTEKKGAVKPAGVRPPQAVGTPDERKR